MNKKAISKIRVGYSPYRQAFKEEKIAQKSEEVAASKEMLKLELKPPVIIATLFVLILALGSLYLANFNKMATKGNMLKRLQVSRQELNEQADQSNLYMAKVKSMNSIMESGRIDHMRKPANVDFVFGDSVIAKAD
ncbi:hypothetical protein IT411_02515 [Candidatus Peregrinibacteria bacterium]|nr:hypothetical protein [Candidatus Peregrinibacteria bacterium]